MRHALYSLIFPSESCFNLSDHFELTIFVPSGLSTNSQTSSLFKSSNSFKKPGLHNGHCGPRMVSSSFVGTLSWSLAGIATIFSSSSASIAANVWGGSSGTCRPGRNIGALGRPSVEPVPRLISLTYADGFFCLIPRPPISSAASSDGLSSSCVGVSGVSGKGMFSGSFGLTGAEELNLGKWLAG